MLMSYFMWVSTIRSVCRRNLSKDSIFIRQTSAYAVAQLNSWFTDSSSDEYVSFGGTSSSCSDLEENLHVLDTNRVIEILRSLRTDPNQAYSYFTHLKKGGFRHNVETYASFVQILCHRGSADLLEGFLLEVIELNRDESGFDILELLELLEVEMDGSVSRVIDALVKGYVKLGMSKMCIDVVLFQTQRKGLIPCTFTCNDLINRVIEEGKLDMAVDIYQQLLRIGLKPNVYTYFLWVKLICRKGSFNEVVLVFKEMKEAGVNPDVYTYNILIELCCKKGNFEEALGVFMEMKEAGVNPDLYTYNLMIKVWCKMGNFEEAVGVFEEMTKAGVNPNEYSYGFYIEGLCSIQRSDLAYELLKSPIPVGNFCYTMVIRSFCNENKLREAETVLLDIENQGFMPDVYCFGALIHAYSKRGDIHKALYLESYMRSKGVETNCVIVSYILQCMCLMGLYTDVCSQFKMYMNEGVILDKVCFNMVVYAMCQLGKGKEALELEEMKGYKIVLDQIHYSTVINSYCLEGKLVDAWDIFKKMKQKGIQPDIITYNILAGAFARKGLAKEALSLVDYMKTQGLTPNIAIQNNIIEGLCIGGQVREAEKFLVSLEKCPDNFSAMINGYCEASHTQKAFDSYINFRNHGILLKKKTGLKLLSSLCMEGQAQSAFELFEKFLDLGHNIKMYSKLMSALCNSGDVLKARLVFDNWINKGLSPDAVMYTIMINGYCKYKFVSKAFELLDDMKCRGILPDMITLTVLIDGCLKSRLYKKAAKIESEMLELQLKPDKLCYTVLIDKRCKMNDIQDAMKLFIEMIDNGLQPDNVTYTTLLSGCHRVQEVDVAVTLLNAMKEQDLKVDQKTKSLMSVLEHGILKVKRVHFI